MTPKSDSKTFGEVTDAGTYEVVVWSGTAWRLMTSGSKEVCQAFLAECRGSNPGRDAADFSMRVVT